MNSALASFLGLVFTAIALYGFYWVIRLAVRDGMIDAGRRAPAEPAAPPAVPGAAPPAVPAERAPAE